LGALLLCILLYFVHIDSGVYLSVSVPTAFQNEVITGLMLSDGHLRNPNDSKRATGYKRLEFTFKSATLDFIHWLKFDILGSICTFTLPTPWPKAPTGFPFSTRALPYFTEIYSSWYSFNETLVA
jgi:hypothetical protein